jgi:hypothetical protein
VALVSCQEADDRCEFLRMLREERRGLDRFAAHFVITYSNEVKLFSERSNSISNDSARPPLDPEVAPRRLPTPIAAKSRCGRNKLVNESVNETLAQLPRWHGTPRDGWDGRTVND